MKATFATWVVFVAALCLAARASAAEHSKEPGPAAKLFEQALVADAEGDPQLRDELLREALEIEPDYQLARWHLGQVYFQGLWRSVDSIGQLVSADPRWQDYRERLAAADGSPASHAELARWCRGNQLQNEAKWHWFQVLGSDPENREALGNLQVKLYRGGYYTDEQIAEFKQGASQAKKAFKRFGDEFKILIKSAEQGDQRERDKALAQLAAVKDPAAIEALMSTLVDVSNDKQSQEFSGQVCLAIVAALGEMREHASTLKLVEIALYAPQESVRHNAAQALRYREPTDYMPLLMASLAVPLESSFSIGVAGNGLVMLSEDVYESGPLADGHHVRASGVLTHTTVRSRAFTGRGSQTRQIDWTVPNTGRDLTSAVTRASNTQIQVANENALRQQRNARIQVVLEIATDQKLGADPKKWWANWLAHNEMYVPDETPVTETSDEYIYAGPDTAPYIPVLGQQTMSCFVAGTPVWTQSGPRPIEQIEVGELVLSQDPISGRLDYRPVVETTIRPPTAVVELSVRDEKIVATRGHRFWVTGEGWRMAKFLNAGASLFAVRGSRTLSGVKELEDETAYNLVVGEYHTYFVGESRLLVHDNNCPLPTMASVPGAAK